MGLLSFLKRQSPADGATAAAVPDSTSPEAIRTRARRRLIGSAVLVVLAVVLLPMVFESRPRPLPVDIPIEIPKRDAAAPVAVPPPRNPTVAAADPPEAPAPTGNTTPQAASPAAPVVIAAAEPASAPPAPKAEPKPDAKPAAKDKPKPEPKAVSKPEPKPSAERKPEAAKPRAAETAQAGGHKEDAARALAMLDGKAASKSAEAPTRFVVQVGAFEQASAARNVRQRVEKLGLHTFQQELVTPQGKRIRVRLGPYSSREEAEKALTKLRASGINAGILPL
ncbi:MAG: SPOR domain-containing protein [Burkholderiales bacterium]